MEKSVVWEAGNLTTHNSHLDTGASSPGDLLCSGKPSLAGESPIGKLEKAEACRTTGGPDVRHEEDEVVYPEGGTQAWLVVFGCWCTLLASLGTMNTIGSFQAYFITHQLADHDAGTVGWIFSVYAFLTFAGGIVVGPVFDVHGAKWLVLAGSVGVCLTMFLMGLCDQYWQLMLVFGVLGGTSTMLLFTPSIAAIGHYFHRARGNATGLATTGSSLGGVVFPLILEALIPRVGFAWATRILGFVFIVLCTIGCVLIRTRLPPAKDASSMPDLRILKDPTFAVTVVGVFLLEWAIFVPLAYISSYAMYKDFSVNFSYEVLVFVNVGSILGRWMPGFYADRIGRYNTMILITIITIVSVLGIWLPAGQTTTGIVLFALVFGFASGSNISLTPVCIGQLCQTENYGRYYATCCTIVSVGCLTGIPIVGEILKSNGGDYWGMIVFVGACYIVALVAFFIARIRQAGWGWRAIF